MSDKLNSHAEARAYAEVVQYRRRYDDDPCLEQVVEVELVDIGNRHLSNTGVPFPFRPVAMTRSPLLKQRCRSSSGSQQCGSTAPAALKVGGCGTTSTLSTSIFSISDRTHRSAPSTPSRSRSRDEG